MWRMVRSTNFRCMNGNDRFCFIFVGDKCTTDEMPKRREADCMPKELVRIEDALAQTSEWNSLAFVFAFNRNWLLSHNLTEFGKFNYSLILISGIILYAALVETCGMTFVLPVSQCDMNYSTQEMGIITAVGFAGVIMSAHVWGFMADRNGRNRTMRPTFLISITCTILSTLTNNFWIFATLRFLTGFLWATRLAITNQSHQIRSLRFSYHSF